MISAMFLTFAVIHLGIWFWGWHAWFAYGRPPALLLILVSGALLFYDNLRIGLGRFIGEGELLKAMTVPTFAWHWTMLPLLIIAAAMLARRAGLGWAGHKFVMGGFCVLATILIALDAPKILQLELYPACLADTVRYTSQVSAEFLCAPGDRVVESGPGAALVAILTNVVVLVIGIALWLRRGWPWMALGAGAMFIAAGAFMNSYYSLPIANFGEILFTAGLIVSAVRFRGAPVATSP